MNDKLGLTDRYRLENKRQFVGYLEDWEEAAVTKKDENAKRRLELKYKSVYMFEKADNFHGEILGVEWLTSGRDPETKQRWAAGWRVSICFKGRRG